MSTLLYFLFWAALFFLMMRFGCGAHIMGHGHGQHEAPGDGTGAVQPRWVPPETDIDPVCRKSVPTDTAKSAVYRGAVYYFCSAEHRDSFEAAPERYIGSQASTDAKSMEHHHG
jgi:YHS domain-containing protein